MFDTVAKRSLLAIYCGNTPVARNDHSCMSLNMKRCTNRKLFSATVVAIAALILNIDAVVVIAFTPNSSGRSSLATGPVSSSIIDINSNKETVLRKVSPISTKRRRNISPARQQKVAGSISSTAVDDNSATTSSSFDERKRQSTHGTANVVVVDDEYFHRNSNKKNELEVQVVMNNDSISTPIRRPSRSTNLLSIDIKRNHSTGKVRKRSSRGKSASSALLTREEERQITYSIRDLRRVMSTRDELLQESSEFSSSSSNEDEFPTEEDWAKACGLDISSLRRVMSEGQEARSVLVSANTGLVKSIAKRHYHVLKQMTIAKGGVGTILTLQDMIQEGNIGLMKAAERFEPERGFRFSTYATYWIRQRILQSITDSSRVIRLPVHVTDTLKKVSKARKEISAKIGRMPSDAELAHHMNISVEKLQRISDKSRSVLSLESPLPNGGNHRSEVDRRTIGDFIASDAPTPEEDAEHKFLQRDIRAVVNELAEREREVLILRFGLDSGKPMSTSDTAAQLGITTDRVRYIETRALNKLRNPQRNYRLKNYLSGHHAAAGNKKPRLQSTLSGRKSVSNSSHSHQNRNKQKKSTQEKFWFF